MESVVSEHVTNSVGAVRADGNSSVQVGNNYTVHNYPSSNLSDADRCLADLRLTDPDLEKTRIEAAKGGLLKDSYKWILDHGDFLQWKNNVQHRLLWIKGDAGKGKTMLLCGIINELRLAKAGAATPVRGGRLSRVTGMMQSLLGSSSFLGGTAIVSFFFCQGTDSRLNHATSVLRGLMYMLLCQSPGLISHIQKKYDHMGRQLFEDSNSFYALSSALADILNDLLAKDCYMVIDALDECKTDRHELLGLITSMISKTTYGKWLVSSRQLHEIDQQLNNSVLKTQLSLELNGCHVSQAIDAYINAKITQLVLLRDNETLQSQIKDKLRDKANGTFLWVALVIQRLQGIETWNILNILEQTPSGLIPFYQQMVAIIEDLSPQNRSYCNSIISTATAVYRPVHLKEIGLLSGLPEEIAHNPQSIREVIDMCGSFLTIRDGFVYLIHQSVKDFFIDQASTKILEHGLSVKHHQLFTKSLEILTHTLRRDIYNLKKPGILIGEIRPPEPDPLAPITYACYHWVDHLRDAIEMGAPNAVDELRDNASVNLFICTKYLNWLEALGLLCQLPMGRLALGQLEALLEKSKIQELIPLIQDAHRFIAFNKVSIASAPLQAYVSALIFSPTRSIIRNLFKKETPEYIAFTSATEAEWSEYIQTFEGHRGCVNTVAFSPDGRLIVSSSDDKTIKIWDLNRRQCINTLLGHKSWIESVKFYSNGQKIISGSGDQTIKVWDSSTGQCLQTLKGHKSAVTCVDVSADVNTIISGSWDQTIKIWNMATGQCEQTLRGHTRAIGSTKLSVHTRQIISASDDGTVRVWELDTGRCVQILEAHDSEIRDLDLTADGQRIDTISFDSIKIWDLDTGRSIQTFKNDIPGHSLWRLAFSPDGQKVISSKHYTVNLWDVSTGECLLELRSHVGQLAFSPDGQYIVASSIDNTIKIWDLHAEQSITSSVFSIALSADGHTMVSGSHDGSIEIWDMSTARCLQMIKSNMTIITSVDISRDGKRVVCGSYSKVEVWERETSQCILSAEGKYSPRRSVALSVDGMLMAISTGVMPTKIWDLSTGKCIREIKNRNVHCLAFSEDGQRIALGTYVSHKYRIEIWDILKTQCIRKLQVASSFKSLYFDPTTSDRLVTNMGIICLDLLPKKGILSTKVSAWHLPSSGCEIPTYTKENNQEDYELIHSNSWITKDGARLIWLPSHYRPDEWTMVGTTMGICSSAGRRLTIQLLPDKINQ